MINKNLSKKYVEISTQTDDLPVESSTQTNYIKSDSESDSDTVSYYDSDSDYDSIPRIPKEYDYAEEESDYSDEEYDYSESEEEEEAYDLDIIDKYNMSFITD